MATNSDTLKVRRTYEIVDERTGAVVSRAGTEDEAWRLAKERTRFGDLYLREVDIREIDRRNREEQIP